MMKMKSSTTMKSCCCWTMMSWTMKTNCATKPKMSYGTMRNCSTKTRRRSCFEKRKSYYS